MGRPLSSDDARGVRPASAPQYEAWSTGVVPALEPVAEGVWSVGSALPYRAPAYTLIHLIEDDAGGVHVLDPGFDDEPARARVVDALAALGHRVEDVASITVTHLHPDHLGLADHLSDVSGAPIQMHAVELRAVRALASTHDRVASLATRLATWGVPEDRRPQLLQRSATASAPVCSVRAASAVEDGELLPVPGRRLQVVHTPGHTAGHIAVRDLDARLLFTGDHVLPTIHPGLGLNLGMVEDRNPIADYLHSLDRVAGWDDHVVLPAHEFRFHGLRARVDGIARHHGARTAAVHAELERDASVSTWELAARIPWTSGWDGLHGPYLVSALQQTAWHRELASAA